MMCAKPITSDFRKHRQAALATANGLCVKCGSPATEVHHVYGRKDNRTKHLRPLCAGCHLLAPMDDAYWEWEDSGQNYVDAFCQFLQTTHPELMEALRIAGRHLEMAKARP